MKTATWNITSEVTILPLAFVLPFVIFLEGFVSIAIEMLTIRQLLPVAGGSVIVTSLIIGVFLLFLAFGYQRGGRHFSQPQKTLRINFTLAAIWLGIGLSYAFVSDFFTLAEKVTGPHILYPLTIYLLMIIAPLIYILGQTVPMTMNMVKQNHLAGKIGGNTLGLSTLGSFLGAILTTLVFMFYLGVAWTIVINACLLLGICLLLSESSTNFFKQLSITAAFIFIIFMFNVSMEQSLFILTNNYANYQIATNPHSPPHNKQKYLIINSAYSSGIDEQLKGFPYIEIVRRILFEDLNLQNANILVLGAGGFSLSAENKHQNNFTYVDIDPQIKQVAIPKFISELNSTLVSDDARHFLQTNQDHYEAIVIDAYSDIKAIPAHLLTKEYMIAIKKRLTEKGTAIFNIIENPTLSDAYSKRIDNTIRAVFKNCMVLPVAYVNRPTNVIYLCNNNYVQNDAHIYTDNLNNSTTDSFSW